MKSLSANGALSNTAWGKAPGFAWIEEVSALKARVTNIVSRAFSAAMYLQSIILGRCPRLRLKSALSALKAQRRGDPFSLVK